MSVGNNPYWWWGVASGMFFAGLFYKLLTPAKPPYS